MLLAIDVGNTNTEFGVFEGENLLGSFRMMTKSNATSDEIGLLVCQYFQRFGLDRTRLEAVMVASVVPQVMYTLTAAHGKIPGSQAHRGRCGRGLRSALRPHGHR